MTSPLTEKTRVGQFILWESDPSFCRDVVTVASGQNLEAGTVLGKITSGGKYAAHDNNASDGTQTAAGILYAACDASDGDVEAVALVRGPAEVVADTLVYKVTSPAVNETAAQADLLAIGIKAIKSS